LLINNISVVIIAKDAENTIEKCLESLKEFSEVILYLNNSIDKTKFIAQKFLNIKIIEGEFLGFGKTKSKASNYATNKWILSLDSDEVLSNDFKCYLNKLNLNNNNKVYSILRINYYKNQEIKHCWSKDEIVRLYNRDKTNYNQALVHEKIIVNKAENELIKGIVKHYPYNNMSDFIIKADRYSSLFANDHVGEKKSSPMKAFSNATYSFIKTYILKRGFLDGYAGLIIAVSHATNNFFKYMKLYELNLELKHEKSNNHSY